MNVAACPCGGGEATACCAVVHADLARGGCGAPSAEALMRSRYVAYVRGDVDYLLATWHPDTRPDAASLAPDPATRWLGLEVKRAVEDGDTAVVEFIARFMVGGRPAVRLQETSRFVREGGRWFYVDGTFR